MSSRLADWLQQRWFGGRRPGPVLLAASACYGTLLAFRHWLYARGALRVHRLPVPVLVVGNFPVGGTGKTPFVLALAQRLVAAGFRPGLVSRGYGRSERRPLRVAPDTAVDACGDEPALLFQRTGLPVFVDADRVAAAARAVAAGCNLVLADDGLQHLRLARDLEIEVLDGARRYGNGRLLPAGPLRERPRPVAFRVVNGGRGEAGEWEMRLRLGSARSLADGVERPLAEFSPGRVHAIAGIGNPRRFFDALRAAGLDPVEHPFPDHHRFERSDFEGIPGPVLMTEKDAVKCRALGLAQAWYVPVEAEMDEDLFRQLIDRLREATP